MKLEFLPAGSVDCPLIRLFWFTQEEASRFAEALRSLAAGARNSVSVHTEPGIEIIGHCELNLRVGDLDRGIIQLGPGTFECVLTRTGWDNMAGLVEPFCDAKPTGFQWLIAGGKDNLLLSHDGHW